MNIALIGYGKMGHEIEKILLTRGHNVTLIIDANNRHDLCGEKLKNVDVAIEFTTPEMAFENIATCLKNNVAIVSGTTGWTEKMAEIEKLCAQENGTFFYASNFSIGVNIFFEINRKLAALMNRFPEYDVTIEEVHHIQKKDAPSGTAITIAEGVLENIERKDKWVCQTTTEPNELEIAAIRRSVVPGTHTVTWESPVDSITINHMAKNRQGLAMGAVMAAEFIADKKGVYSMKDLMAL